MVRSSCQGLSPIEELRKRAEIAERTLQFVLAAILWKELADVTEDRSEGEEALSRAEAAVSRSIYKDVIKEMRCSSTIV